MAVSGASLRESLLAALKSVPLGQSAGQRVLGRLADALPAAVDAALQTASTGDSQRQNFAPMLGGPGITKSDLLVINKTDLAPYVGADLAVMEADTRRMRPDHAGRRPYVMCKLKTGAGLAEVVACIEQRGRLQPAA